MEKANEIASDYGIDLSSPRTAGRQQHHNNVLADTSLAYWIDENLVVRLPGFQAQLLIPGK